MLEKIDETIKVLCETIQKEVTKGKETLVPEKITALALLIEARVNLNKADNGFGSSNKKEPEKEALAELSVMLTIKEAATKFNLPEHFVRQLVWQKKVKFVKAGRKYLINQQSLIDYLNEGEKGV